MAAIKPIVRSIEARSGNGSQRGRRDARIATVATTFADALRECLTALGGVHTKAEIVAWIQQHYPNKWKDTTLAGHLYGFCRALAKDAGVSMHVLDQALWKYSELNQT